MLGVLNSKVTRVEPVFGWLEKHGGERWPAQLISLVDGLEIPPNPGPLVQIDFREEIKVPPSPRRLAWMIRNTERLTPRDGRDWNLCRKRISEHPERENALETLDHGETGGIAAKLKLEGRTSADCLIDCERLVIWIEGKRNDWLEYSTKWDVTRDQLARNAEAAWLYATSLGKDSCVVICHEHPLKHHEQLLVEGYRRGTWIGGWPHLTDEERRRLGARIGTVTWRMIAEQWGPIADLLV